MLLSVPSLIGVAHLFHHELQFHGGKGGTEALDEGCLGG